MKTTEIVFVSSMVLFLSLKFFLNFSLVHCSLEIVFLEGLWLGGNWIMSLASLWQADRGGGGSSVLKKSWKNGEEESRLNTALVKLVQH